MATLSFFHMNLSFFKSIFKQKSLLNDLSCSKVFENLKQVAQENDLFVYRDITIYHHTKSFFIPLLILDQTRGIYIFEYKTWSFKDLNNATARVSQDENISDKSLAFDKTHKIIRQKFNELTHSNGVDIFNFAIMENLTIQDYEKLDISLQELLPQSKIIFNDSTDTEILSKLKNVKKPDNSLPDVAHIMGNLLIQYLILSDNKTMYMASKEQMRFIDAEVKGHQTLFGENGSGKTNSILLKTILYKLKRPDKKIIIISPTTLACDILKKKLLNIVEHAIVELDITSIEIITPIELLNRHLSKYNKPLLDNTIYINDMLMKKKFHTADFIICDDSDLLGEDFVLYLKHIQNKSNLLISTNKKTLDADFIFEKSFYGKDLNIEFIKTNPHAKALQIIAKLLQDNKAEDILVVSDELSKKQLSDDLEFFIKDKATLLDSSKNLIDQELDNLLLTTYNQISSINAKFVILLGINETSEMELKYAVNSAKKSAFILYEEENETLINLKEHFKQTGN